MNNWKRIFCAALLASAVICTLPIQAQQYASYGTATILSGGTNNVANGATNTYNSGVFTVTRQEYLPIMIKYAFHTAPVGDTPTVRMRLVESIDGTNWESTAPLHVLAASGATNTCVWVTNLTAAGIAYYRINTIENTNSAVITNVTVTYGIKR